MTVTVKTMTQFCSVPADCRFNIHVRQNYQTIYPLTSHAF